ncbi:DUF996 domain-containing protein [Ferroplasma sp.]|uniref:DUF996 domain-containing protein n=1 Tax=Ferroplasma sp. TaxID=2591003 RepID=UPI0026271E95|nr:DUF996 domain-containing protein [Ferroplasma sp.]
MYRQHIPELESAKTYGIIGIILQFIGVAADVFLHGLGFIISIVGLILLLLAIKSISDYYGNSKPFRYILYSIISSIVFGVISALFIILFLVPVILGISASSNPGSAAPALLSNIGLIFTVILLVILAVLIPIIFEYLAYNEISELTGIGDFHTAALLLLIGIILTVIVVGVLLLIVGIIMLIIGFSKLPDYAKPVVIDQPGAQDYNQGFNQ